ncbi:MAG TPA: hypothetical protein VGM25_02345 [Caulobacteraceae bacterium]
MLGGALTDRQIIPPVPDMTHLTNISEEASLVLVAELISVLEKERQAHGGPSLVAALKAAVAQAFTHNPPASPGLRIGLADAQLVLEWAEKAAAERQGARPDDREAKPGEGR